MITLSIILAVHFNYVQADNQTTLRYHILAVEYSEGCQTMINHNLTSSCPVLNQIWKYDTSNKYISGNIILSHGKYIRSNPQIKNDYLWYNDSKTIVCVDCNLPLDKPDVFQTIFIEPSSFVYINKTQTLNNTNTWTSFSNRYVSPDCISSTIGYSDFLLNDTINYMLSNCTITNIHNNQTNFIKQTPFQYNNPFSSLHMQTYLKELMHGHDFFNGNHTLGGLGIGNCINIKCDYKDPYRNPKW